MKNGVAEGVASDSHDTIQEPYPFGTKCVTANPSVISWRVLTICLPICNSNQLRQLWISSRISGRTISYLFKCKKKLKEKEITYNTWAVNKYSESLEEPFFMDWKYSAVRYEMMQFYTMKQKFLCWTVQKFELKCF